MVNTEIRLIIVFAAEDGEALHNKQKQEWELSVAQTKNHIAKSSSQEWMWDLDLLEGWALII